MKRMYYFFCFLVLFWQPFYVNGCERTFEDIMPLKDFVNALHELSIYNTVTFITLKKEGELFDGMSRRPLRDYEELEGKWDILWAMVEKAHSADGSGELLSTKDKRKVDAVEQRGFENEVFDELRGNETRDRDEVFDELRGNEIRDRDEVFDELHGNEIRDRGEVFDELHGNETRDRDEVFDELHGNETRDRNEVFDELHGNETRDRDEGKGVFIDKKPGKESRTVSKWNRFSNDQQMVRNTDRRSVVNGLQVQKVSSLIENNKYITLSEIAKETGLTITVVNQIIDILKNRKTRRLVRRGSRNNKGYWIFFTEGVDLSNKEIRNRRNENVLFFIRGNSQITIAELADKIGLSASSIAIIIRDLKDKGYLVRNGLHLKVLKGGEQYYDLPK